MDIKRILADLQAERSRLEKAIAAIEALQGTSSAEIAAPAKRRGRPPLNQAGSAAGQQTGKRTRRAMSPAARKRISDMMKKRWAARKKAAGAKS